LTIKKLKFLSIIIIFLICFPLHFLYDLFPNIITSIISPVNESIWEHMKILFTSTILSVPLQSMYINYKKETFNNITLSNYASSIINIIIFLILFIPIYKLIGENFIITIIIMFTSIVISQLTTTSLLKTKETQFNKYSYILIIITYLIFGYFTYNPLDLEIFVDPTNNIYKK
jgi:hypothetical protein